MQLLFLMLEEPLHQADQNFLPSMAVEVVDRQLQQLQRNSALRPTELRIGNSRPSFSVASQPWHPSRCAKTSLRMTHPHDDAGNVRKSFFWIRGAIRGPLRVCRWEKHAVLLIRHQWPPVFLRCFARAWDDAQRLKHISHTNMASEVTIRQQQFTSRRQKIT